MTTQSASSGWWTRFSFDGITRYDQGAYDLVGGEELCRQRLDAFHMQRGEEVACLLIEEACGFVHRSRHMSVLITNLKQSRDHGIQSLQ